VRQPHEADFAGFVPSLRDAAMHCVLVHFEASPRLAGLSAADVDAICSRLPLDLDLELAGQRVHSELYWRRRALARWRHPAVEAHGGSWKRLWFELNLQDALEAFDPAASSLDELRRLATFSARWVRSLTLRQLPSRLDLAALLDCLGHDLASLSVRWGMGQVGMDYAPALFGARLHDVRCLARALERTRGLCRLDLRGAGLDCDRTRLLCGGLADCATVTHLDLSANRVGDRGCRAVARVLGAAGAGGGSGGGPCLVALSLADNAIHCEGARALARAVASAPALERLDVSQNLVGDDGAVALLAHAAGASRLRVLRLGSNLLTAESVPAARDLILSSAGGEGDARGGGSRLRELCLRCNALGEGAGPVLLGALAPGSAVPGFGGGASGRGGGGGGGGGADGAAAAATPGLRVLGVARCGLAAHDEIAIAELTGEREDTSL